MASGTGKQKTVQIRVESTDSCTQISWLSLRGYSYSTSYSAGPSWGSRWPAQS